MGEEWRVQGQGSYGTYKFQRNIGLGIRDFSTIFASVYCKYLLPTVAWGDNGSASSLISSIHCRKLLRIASIRIQVLA